MKKCTIESKSKIRYPEDNCIYFCLCEICKYYKEV